MPDRLSDNALEDCAPDDLPPGARPAFSLQHLPQNLFSIGLSDRDSIRSGIKTFGRKTEMGRIVAISGGDLTSTRPLNLHAIQLSGQANPNVLFVGTASGDADGYIASIEKEYEHLGCQVKSLCLVTQTYSNEDIDKLLSWADIIYVGGGDTVSMMLVWKQHGFDEKLKEIYRKDAAVLTGLSAGAICWFHCGHSDSESFRGRADWHYCWAEDMLNFFAYAFCPHYNEEGRDSFDSMLKDKGLTGLALENDTAFVENNGNQYFIRSNASAKAFEIRYRNGLMEKKTVAFL